MTALYTVSTGNPIQAADINQLVNAFGASTIFNVKTQYGGAVDGSTNDGTAIANAIAAAGAAGGGFVLIPGTSAISAPINLNQYGVILISTGVGGLKPSASFSGSQIINITSDNCGMRDMTIAYANTTYSSNPSADAIGINGAHNVTLMNVYTNYINGWSVNCISPSYTANFWPQFINVHAYQCKAGMHLLGHTNSGFDQGAALTNCIMDQIKNGDAYFFEDVHDVTCNGIEGSVTAGSGYTLHIKGASAAIYINGFDLGPAPGPATSATFEIESGSNGTPRQITMNGGIIEGGSTGVAIVAGTQIKIIGADIYNNGTHGMDISGGDGIIIEDCSFFDNGATIGSTRYDLNAHTTGNVDIANCVFSTPHGTATQQVDNVINATAGTVSVHDCIFNGTSFTQNLIFNGFPTYVRNNIGYNPVGPITPPSVPASGVAAGYKASDFMVYITGGTVTDISIGGTSTGRTTGSFLVPAQSYIVLTYSVAPTWTWFGN